MAPSGRRQRRLVLHWPRRRPPKGHRRVAPQRLDPLRSRRAATVRRHHPPPGHRPADGNAADGAGVRNELQRSRPVAAASRRRHSAVAGAAGAGVAGAVRPGRRRPRGIRPSRGDQRLRRAGDHQPLDRRLGCWRIRPLGGGFARLDVAAAAHSPHFQLHIPSNALLPPSPGAGGGYEAPSSARRGTEPVGAAGRRSTDFSAGDPIPGRAAAAVEAIGVQRDRLCRGPFAGASRRRRRGWDCGWFVRPRRPRPPNRPGWGNSGPSSTASWRGTSAAT